MSWLHVEVQLELVRMRAQPQLVELGGPLVVQPGLDEVLGEHAALGEEGVVSLEADSSFLTEGGVFTDDLIETWIDYKRKHEIDTLKLRPHPWEFYLYFDI